MNLDIQFIDPNLVQFKTARNLSGFTVEGTNLIYNFQKLIKDEVIKLNRFSITSYVYSNILASSTLTITPSTNNTELIISLKIKNSYTIDAFENFDKVLQSSNNKGFYYSTFKYIQIVNWIKDTITSNETLYILKLNEPFINEPFNLISDLRTYTNNVNQIRTEEVKKVSILSPPNFYLKSTSVKKDTTYNNTEDIVGLDKEIQSKLTSQYLNFYEGAVKLNIDYSVYSEFVHFSSAEERLLNFVYKLKLIQDLKTKLDLVPIQLFKDQYQDSINKIIQEFDGFDNYLYYSSYPRDINDNLVSTTSNEGLLWIYENQTNAKSFDLQNIYKLTRTIPIGIITNDSGHFIKFIQMIGQHFDILWTYTKHVSTLHNKSEGLYDGLDKDLIYSVLKSFGWNPTHDLQYLDLWEYRLGNNTYTNGAIVIDPTFKKEDIIKETWKRILNNLPFLYKHKGTAEGIRALVNCVSGDTKVNTKDGIYEVKDLVGKEIETASKDGIFRLAKWNYYGQQKLYKVVMENGDIIRATAEHEWYVTKNGCKNEFNKTTTIQLKNKNIPLYGFATFDYNEAEWKEGVQRGLIFGDGSVVYKGSGISQFGDSRHLLFDFFDNVKTHRYKEDPEGRVSVSGAHKYPVNWKTEIPDTSFSRSYIRGFIAGFIAADGNVDRTGGTILDQVNLDSLIKVRELAAYAGLITKKITTIHQFSNLTNKSFILYRLGFLKSCMYDDKMILKQAHKDKMFNTNKPRKTSTMKVIDVIEDVVEDVYCCVEPETHTWLTDKGYLTSNCYGIPRTELQILEYSGTNKLNVKSVLKLDKFNYAIDLVDGTVSFDWIKHNTMEFRFKLNSNTNSTILTKDTISIETEYTSNDNGVFKLVINGNAYINKSTQIYDNEWWSFGLINDLDGNYNYYLKRRFQDLIVQNHSGSFIPSAPDDLVYSATGSCVLGSFNGNIQEFRFWNEELTEESFDEHVIAPTMYSGNEITSAYNNLLVRFPFGGDVKSYNHFSTGSLYSSQPNQTTQYEATFSGFADEVNYEPQNETYYYTWVDMSGNRTVSNKVRIIENPLFKDLSVNSRSDSSLNSHPNDTNKIGIFLSHSFEVNKDISQFIGGKSLDDLIGVMDSTNSNLYQGLEGVRRFYMKQYNGKCRTQDYMKLINYFSNGLFKQIESMIPARANLLSELVIESNLLYRNKMPINRTKTLPIINQVNGIINDEIEQVVPYGFYNSFNGELNVNIDSKMTGFENSNFINIIGFENASSIYKLKELKYLPDGTPYYVYKNVQSYIPTINKYSKSDTLEMLDGSGNYVKADVKDAVHIGLLNNRFNGCKLTAQAINQPSEDGYNNIPIIEVFYNDSKNIIV